MAESFEGRPLAALLLRGLRVLRDRFASCSKQGSEADMAAGRQVTRENGGKKSKKKKGKEGLKTRLKRKEMRTHVHLSIMVARLTTTYLV